MSYLTVIGEAGKSTKAGNKLYICECVCGEQRLLTKQSISINMSCGCKKGELISDSQIRHGMSYTRTYRIYRGMIGRCYRKKNKDYFRYGGAGIGVSDEWINGGFDKFFEDMGECPGSRYSIDRIDSSGNYCKENCRWATIEQQNRNRSNCRHLEIDGIDMSLTEAAKHVGINHATIHSRLKRGWDVRKAVFHPVQGENA